MAKYVKPEYITDDDVQTYSRHIDNIKRPKIVDRIKVLGIIFGLVTSWRILKQKMGAFGAFIFLLPALPFLITTAYVVPTDKTVGTLITTAIWNQDVVDNIIAIYALVTAGYMLIPYQGDSLVTIGSGYTRGARLASSFLTYGFGRLPDTFSSLTSVEVAVVGTSSVTITGLAVNTEYGKDDDTENYNNHTGSATGLTLTLVANQVRVWDLTAYFASLAADDRFNLHITSADTPAGTPIVLYTLINYVKA